MDFVVGQRWVSQAEPQLGLGIVVETDGRHMTVHYPACEEERMYAAYSAPLARIAFQAGDTLHDAEQQLLTVKAVEELKGLNYYLVEDANGEEQILPESRLSGLIQLSSPTQRLYSGQFDKNKTFQLRIATLQYRAQLQQSAARGLLGPRTNLLAHQMYIASEVASRFAPRVLLADEVGLGKTIEAGMILHYQLQTGLTKRALIVVPEPLLHQWLVEMLRKFNLRFSLFDKARYTALQEAGEINPFESEQLVLCSLDLLCSDPAIASNAEKADWDLLIVDEAHHLYWSPDNTTSADVEPAAKPSDRSGVSTEYRVIEELSKSCAGLLLLTATPEQVGIASHFARLRLLDPARFHDLNEFIAQQEKFVGLNEVVTQLLNQQVLSATQQAVLAQYIQPDEQGSDTQQLVNQLLDCHGTGRVLFRNTRAAIKNFPARLPVGYPLEIPDIYRERSGLYPEHLSSEQNGQWLREDPRVAWLEGLLKGLRNEKVLLICHHASTAIDLEKHLHFNAGIRSTAFSEDLSIIERDRAAAYFADTEAGAQVMICSEIGSEGRNFQFAHHLVLFDLPTNPDLLEQRIGRLDRIGQAHDIQIHIPYLQGGASEYLYRWYHEGLNAFRHSFSAGLAVYNFFEKNLQPWLAETTPTDESTFEALLEKTITHTATLRNELAQGRDQLLELNSCNVEVATNIIETVGEAEQSEVLSNYMSLVFDTFGIEQDYHSEHCQVLRPTDQMLTAQFPGVKEEGVTVTYDRSKAQSREDMEFMTWEHPMVDESMEMIAGTELGNAAIGAIKVKSLPAGSVLLECFFVTECSAPRDLQIQRYLPATPMRVLIDMQGNVLTKAIKYAQLNKIRSHVKRTSRPAIVKQLKPELEKMVACAQRIADAEAMPLIETAGVQLSETLDAELLRLRQLNKRNQSIRPAEIEYFAKQKTSALTHLKNASANLQAVRIIINT